MARFQFMFTVLCPICNEHFEISHFDIEVICNGQVWRCTRCNGEIGLHLTPLALDGAETVSQIGSLEQSNSVNKKLVG